MRVHDAVDDHGRRRLKRERGRDQALGVGGIGVDVPVLGDIDDHRQPEMRVRGELIDRQEGRDLELALLRGRCAWRQRREQDGQRGQRENGTVGDGSLLQDGLHDRRRRHSSR